MKYSQMENTLKTMSRKPEGQRGTVLLMVLGLAIMLSGLGLLAVQHTRYELQSAGNYYDSVQTEYVAEGSQVLSSMILSANVGWYLPELRSLADQNLPSGACPAGSIEMNSGTYAQIPAFSGLCGGWDGGLATGEPMWGRANVSTCMSSCIYRPISHPPPAGFSHDQSANTDISFKKFEVCSSGTFGGPGISGPAARYLRSRSGIGGTVMIGPVNEE